MKFIVETWEEVSGTYEVEASSLEEAKAKFTSGDPSRLIDWTGVEQIDYQAFEVNVNRIKEIE